MKTVVFTPRRKARQGKVSKTVAVAVKRESVLGRERDTVAYGVLPHLPFGARSRGSNQSSAHKIPKGLVFRHVARLRRVRAYAARKAARMAVSGKLPFRGGQKRAAHAAMCACSAPSRLLFSCKKEESSLFLTALLSIYFCSPSQGHDGASCFPSISCGDDGSGFSFSFVRCAKCGRGNGLPFSSFWVFCFGKQTYRISLSPFCKFCVIFLVLLTDSQYLRKCPVSR